jgi:putative acetyltransferase
MIKLLTAKKKKSLLNDLRKSPDFISELSFVAMADGNIVGHILLFPMEVEENNKKHKILSLSPLGVIPEYQNKAWVKCSQSIL